MSKKNQEAETRKKRAFVIMPFSPTKSCADWDSVYQNLILPAVNGSGFGYECDRSEIKGGAFIKDILLNLYQADVVVADLTDWNPNVFYELGVRHTLRNRTILISQDTHNIPSDLKAYGVIGYKPDIGGLARFKKELRKRLKVIETEPERGDNPVSDYIKNRTYILFDYERHDVLRRLSALHAELHDNATTIIRNKQHYDDMRHPIMGVFTRATEDILTSQYIDIGIEANFALKQTLLSMQKLDYLAKLLTAPSEELRSSHKALYEFFADAALAGLFRVRGTVNKLVQDLSNNDYVLEHRQPIFRSIFWESSSSEIEEWAKKLSDQEAKQRAEREKATGKAGDPPAGPADPTA